VLHLQRISAGRDSTRRVPRINISIRRWTDSATLSVAQPSAATMSVPPKRGREFHDSSRRCCVTSHVFDTHVPFFFSSLPLDDLKLTQQTGSQTLNSRFSTRVFFGIKRKSRMSSEFSHKPSPTASDLDSLAVSGGRTRELRLCNWVCGHNSWQECRTFPWFSGSVIDLSSRWSLRYSGNLLSLGISPR
jgi:hypothetical protein